MSSMRVIRPKAILPSGSGTPSPGRFDADEVAAGTVDVALAAGEGVGPAP
jgi:hypothetical protein